MFSWGGGGGGGGGFAPKSSWKQEFNRRQKWPPGKYRHGRETPGGPTCTYGRQMSRKLAGCHSCHVLSISCVKFGGKHCAATVRAVTICGGGGAAIHNVTAMELGAMNKTVFFSLTLFTVTEDF
jgi:hypothetical protein